MAEISHARPVELNGRLLSFLLENPHPGPNTCSEVIGLIDLLKLPSPCHWLFKVAASTVSNKYTQSSRTSYSPHWCSSYQRCIIPLLHSKPLLDFSHPQPAFSCSRWLGWLEDPEIYLWGSEHTWLLGLVAGDYCQWAYGSTKKGSIHLPLSWILIVVISKTQLWNFLFSPCRITQAHNLSFTWLPT